ncbi:hypothetical protein SFHH103_06666 (plasmid) [Sinorhizobium fredii HH103]|uniref:Amidohydrolase-related domain-containing protein n=3 Tax=Rhizobium fredii TaxID=380 RepID=G9AJ92_SINF1|nr:hypothetical protein SFHH103_06666 [Sinorhizobium fredii HH103]
MCINETRHQQEAAGVNHLVGLHLDIAFHDLLDAAIGDGDATLKFTVFRDDAGIAEIQVDPGHWFALLDAAPVFQGDSYSHSIDYCIPIAHMLYTRYRNFGMQESRMNVLFENAKVLTLDPADSVFDSVSVLVEGGRIAAIGSELRGRAGNDCRIIDASGHLVMPGLVNAHFHSPGNLMRGSLKSSPLEIFMLMEVPPFRAAPLSARINYVCTMIGAIEMLRTGVTAVQDDAFFAPVPTPGGIDGVMQAYADIGIRARVSLDQPNVIEHEKYPYLREILPADIRRRMEAAPLQSDEELEALYRWFIGKWNNAADGRLSVAVSCSAPQRVTPNYLKVLHGLSQEHDLPYYIHTLETKLQRVLGAEKYGKSLIQYLGDSEVLDHRTNLMHCIWVDDADMDLIAEKGSVVAHNPLCNLRLGSGIMPFRQFRNRGVPICLGSDEAISDDAINMWNVAKTAGLVHNITDPEYQNWPDAAEILSCLVGGGARAMLAEGRTGQIAPGLAADLIMLRLDGSAFAPLNDLKRQLIYAENGSSVVMTMVNGRIVFEDGRVTTVDEAALHAEANEIIAENRAVWAAEFESSYELQPYYREMYLRASRQDVGMNRWVGGETYSASTAVGSKKLGDYNRGQPQIQGDSNVA